MRNQLSLLLLLLAAASCNKNADTRIAGILCTDCITVSGQVTTPPNGAPVGDVVVRAFAGNAATGTEYAYARTDNAGNYSFQVDRSFLAAVGTPVMLKGSKSDFLTNDYDTDDVAILSAPTGNSIQKNFLLYQKATITIHLTSTALPPGSVIVQHRSFGAPPPLPSLQLTQIIRADRNLDTTYNIITAGGVPTYLDFQGSWRDTVTVAPGGNLLVNVNL